MTLPLVTMGLRRPLPIEVTAVTRPFWDGLERQQFLVPACLGCGRLSFPPRVICPGCHGRDFEWRPVSGRGSLYAATRVHNTPAIYGILSPVRVAVVDLDEGVRIVTRLLPTGAEPVLDSPVELVVTAHPEGRHYAARLLSRPP
jgi:uncharacterized OB-fold protein